MDDVSMAELHREADQVLQAIVPADLKVQGWVYRDIYVRFTHAGFAAFLAALGVGQFKIVALSRSLASLRAQFLMSPEAVKNATRHLEGRVRNAAGLVE